MNHINLIQLNDQTCEIEMVTFRQIIAIIQKIENKVYNKHTNRYQIPISAQQKFIDDMQNFNISVTKVQHSETNVPNKTAKKNKMCVENIDGDMVVSFGYNAKAVDIIRQHGGSTFDGQSKRWKLNPNKSNEILNELKSIFPL